VSRPPADFANFVAAAVQRNTSEFVVLSRRHRIAREVWDYLNDHRTRCAFVFSSRRRCSNTVADGSEWCSTHRANPQVADPSRTENVESP
jgi:hypothetical protein